MTMQVPIEAAAEELPPPPYTPQDPDSIVVPEYEAPQPPDLSTLSVRTSLRGGYTRHLPEQEPEPPSALSSATEYFAERPFQGEPALHTPGVDLNVLEHNIYFDSGFTPTRLPFPHPSDAYLGRDITGQDWATFVNFLFPMQEEEKVRTGTDEKSHHFANLQSPERRQRVQAVVAEWNAGFFAPRSIRVIANFEAPPNSYEDPLVQDYAQYQESVNRARAAPGYEFPPTSFAGPSQPGPSTTARLDRHRSGSLSSICSSSSSSSDSSIDSIKSKDLEHATVPEIKTLLAAFRADPSKTNHLCKSVKELRRQLRSQHLALSSSDPYKSKASKDEKKRFKEDRRALKKDIKAIIKDAKSQRQFEKKSRRAARKTRHEARRTERKLLKSQRREGKRSERNAERDAKRNIDRQIREQDRLRASASSHNQNQNQPFPVPGIPQARAAVVRTTSWGVDRTNDLSAWGRQKAMDAASAAQYRATAVRRSSQDAVEAGRQRAREAELRASNAAVAARARGADAVTAAKERARVAAQRAQGAGQQARIAAAEGSQRQFDGEARASAAVAGRRAQAAAAVLAERNANRDWDAEGKARAREAQAEAFAAEERAQATTSTAAGDGGEATHENWGERAAAAELRAQTTASDAAGKDWGADGRGRATEAVGQARNAAGDAGGMEWGADGRARAAEAVARAQEAAGDPSSTEYGVEGSNTAAAAVQRARETAAAASSEGKEAEERVVAA